MRAGSPLLIYSSSRHRIDLHPLVALLAAVLAGVIWAVAAGQPLTVGEYCLRLLASGVFLAFGLAVLWFGASWLAALAVTAVAVFLGWSLSPAELAELASFGAVVTASAVYFRCPEKAAALALGLFVGLVAAGMDEKAPAVLVLFGLLFTGRLIWHLGFERLTKKRLVLFFIKLVIGLAVAGLVTLVTAPLISFPWASVDFVALPRVWPVALVVLGLVGLRGLWGTLLLKTDRSPKWRGGRLFLVAFGAGIAGIVFLVHRFGAAVLAPQALDHLEAWGLTSYNAAMLLPALLGAALAFGAGIDRSLYKNAWLPRQLRSGQPKAKAKLKIAFDASPLLVNKTGVAYYTERVVEHIAKQYPKDVELIGFYYNFLGRRSTKHFPSAANLRYRPIHFLPSKVIYQLRRWGMSLPLEVLVKEPVDFVLFANFWGYPSLTDTAAAPVIHDLTYLDVPESVAPKNRRDLTRLVPEQIKRSRFVVTVSEFSKRGIVNAYGVAAEDVLVTPIPPLPAHQHRAADQRAKLKELGITKPFVLFLGTVGGRRNIVNLVDAYERLPQKLRSAYALVLVGRLEWDSQAEVSRFNHAREQGLEVIHLGYVDDHTKAMLYENAALFVHPSSYEGFGMPVLEAMNHAIPCALSDIAIFKEVAGDAALYFDQTDPEAISRTLQDLLGDPAKRKRYGELAKDKAATYKWEEVAAAIVDRIRRSLAA